MTPSARPVTLADVGRVLHPGHGWRPVRVAGCPEVTYDFPLGARAPGRTIRVYAGLTSAGTPAPGGNDFRVVEVDHPRRTARYVGRVPHRSRLWEAKLRTLVSGVVARYPDPARALAARLLREAGEIGLPAATEGSGPCPKRN